MITEELKSALKQISLLGGEDLLALAEWFRGNGRDSLRARGASDELIGGFRIEVDREGDTPLTLG